MRLSGESNCGLFKYILNYIISIEHMKYEGVFATDILRYLLLLLLLVRILSLSSGLGVFQSNLSPKPNIADVRNQAKLQPTMVGGRFSGNTKHRSLLLVEFRKRPR